MPHVRVLLWIIIIGLCSHHTDTFEVTSSDEVIIITGDSARFYFSVKPWPPPCWYCLPGRPEYEKYQDVEMEFRTTAHGSDDLLCDVTYYNGTFDDTTGNCSLHNVRMEDYLEQVDAVEFVLTYSNLLDIGIYRLVIKYGTFTEQQPLIEETTDLNVHAAPSYPNVTSWPSTNVDIDVNVTFTCRVNNGNPPADLRWTRGWYEEVPMTEYKKGSELGDDTIGRFSMRAAKADHGLSYICHAWNQLNPNSPSTSSIALTVNYIPEVQVDPCSNADLTYYVMEKTSVRFECVIDANPEWTGLQWWKNTSSGENDIPGKEWNDTIHMVYQASRDESGQYGCYANNSKGQSKKSSCTLDVQYKPEVSVTAVTPVTQGERIQSTCSSDANPEVEDYWWQKENNQTFQLLNQTELTIDNADPKDTGNYTCVARNIPHTGSKAIGEATVEVLVKFSPLWQEYSLTKFTGRESEYAEIVCDSWAYPKVTFTWEFNGQILTPSSGKTITNEDYRSIVKISSVKNEDLGTYTCHAENSEGTNNFYLYLQSPGNPDRPQHCDVSDRSSDTISMKCVPGYDGGEELGFTADAQPDKGKAESKATTTEWDGDIAVVTVQGLHPLTQYLLYIYANNMYGRSDSAYNVHANTTDGPEPSPSAPGDGLNIGVIVGGTIGIILAVALLVGLAAFAYWKYQPKEKKDDENDDDESESMNGVNHVGKRHKRSMKDGYDMGIYNEAFDDRSLERQRSVPNDYIDHPGMVKVQQAMSGAGALEPVGWKTSRDHNHVRSPDDVRIEDHGTVRLDVHSVGNTAPLSPTTERVYYTARKNAYEQRERQANLAGMGALSHSSHQLLAVSHDPVAPPRKRRSRVSFDDEWWEVDRENLRLDKRLGEGAFGEVWRGIANGIGNQHGQKFVAVKMLRDGSTVDEQRALLKELEVMKLIKPHRNVIGLQGCCAATEEEPMFIIMDYAARGNLQQHLRDNRQPPASARKLTAADLTMFALQIAYGMDHISSKELLHRDLAARNVLLDHDFTCKISDFGFARDVIDCRHYESKTQRRLPLRWMAPESLIDSVYTTKSDVWSFGIVLWEIVTLGSSPYPGVSGPEVMEMIKRGYRMEKPRHCPSPFYGLMMECWHVDPTYRPTFSALCKKLEAILDYITEDPDGSIPVFRMRDNMFDIHRNLPGEKC